MTDRGQPQKGAPDHIWTVVRTVLTTLITAGILWAAGNVDTIGDRVESMSAILGTLDAQQKTMIVEQKQTHDAVLVMGATMVTKEELERKLRLLQDEVNEVEKRLTQLEASK
ncbi:MAG: hypothetical protein KDD43_16720 [Bdellovibrionales bacterium]|nr:hypothetical protein [Bdellovibrionales bacterium]